jgi:FixJ family two-component response regulator
MVASNPGNVYVGVVDDDQSLRRSVARLLRAVGMQPITYACAEEFVADLKKPHFDCLVLDLQLPGMSGIELRNLLTAQGATTPVLFVTAHDDPKSRTQALAGPCAGFFLKTDAGSELVEAIRRVV